MQETKNSQVSPAETAAHKCAIWARVSQYDQSAESQLPELRGLAAGKGLEIAAEIIMEGSAWSMSNGKGAEFDARRAELLEGARLGKYATVLVWGLDRLSRRGAEDMLAFVRRLSETGCKLVSIKDPWVESLTDPMIREMLLGIFATVARFESERRSERMKISIAARKAKGVSVGRTKGAADKGKRKRSGYIAAWEEGGKRRAPREQRESGSAA